MRLLIILTVLYSVSILAAVNNQFIRDGGFEIGLFGLDIETFPRYTNNLVTVGNFGRSKESPISGTYSLSIPGRSEGGYLFTFETFNLLAGKKYNLKISLRSKGSIHVGVEVDKSRWKKIYRKIFKSKKGDLSVKASFIAGEGDNNSILVPHMLRLRIFNKKLVKIDNISLTGPSLHKTVQPEIYIRPEIFPGIYNISDDASFIIFSKKNRNQDIVYKITDVFSNTLIRKGVIVKDRKVEKINVPTNHRGAYEVRVNYKGKTYSRQYVVINPGKKSGINSQLFSVCAEENGRKTYENILFSSNAMYKLAAEIGIKNVRVFSLAMPDMLSTDGKLYDYTQLNQSLALINKYNMRPMVELGSNVMSRIPGWMRTDTKWKGYRGNLGSFNILDGIRVKTNKNRFKRRGGGMYLDLNIYKNYLNKVIGHLKYKDIDYEVWNEPGYKFTIKDFSKIITITRNVINKKSPQATLVGFSSTISHEDINKGHDLKRFPTFLNKLANHGFLDDIDVLSYHNRHAYFYYGPNYDQRNFETGFELRLKEILKKNNRAIPIWSTEFGLPWNSRHESRVDFMGCKKSCTKGVNKLNWGYLEVSRQLPMVYASALANGVKRLFWFSLDSSVSTIAHSRRRWGFFDGQMEPMPHIAVYDAMSELLSDVTFVKRLDTSNGTRIYVFKKSHTLLFLGYNMLGNKSVLSLPVGECSSRILDIAGRNLMDSSSCLSKISIGSWPKYIFVHINKISNKAINIMLNNITLN